MAASLAAPHGFPCPAAMAGRVDLAANDGGGTAWLAASPLGKRPWAADADAGEGMAAPRDGDAEAGYSPHKIARLVAPIPDAPWSPDGRPALKHRLEDDGDVDMDGTAMPELGGPTMMGLASAVGAVDDENHNHNGRRVAAASPRAKRIRTAAPECAPAVVPAPVENVKVVAPPAAQAPATMLALVPVSKPPPAPVMAAPPIAIELAEGVPLPSPLRLMQRCVATALAPWRAVADVNAGEGPLSFDYVDASEPIDWRQMQMVVYQPPVDWARAAATATAGDANDDEDTESPNSSMEL